MCFASSALFLFYRTKRMAGTKKTPVWPTFSRSSMDQHNCQGHEVCASSFGFKRHSVKTLLSQKPGPVFTCVGYCWFTDCPVRAHVEVTDECTLKATVVFSGGDVCHNTHELKRRPVRAYACQFTAELLQTKLPRSLYLESMHKLPQMVIDSGCRDNAPSKDVLKT